MLQLAAKPTTGTVMDLMKTKTSGLHVGCACRSWFIAQVGLVVCHPIPPQGLFVCVVCCRIKKQVVKERVVRVAIPELSIMLLGYDQQVKGFYLLQCENVLSS